jgi:hypothetical protein
MKLVACDTKFNNESVNDSKIKSYCLFPQIFLLSKFKYFCFVTVFDMSLISRSCKNDHIIMPFIHVINQSIVVLINLSNSVENKHVNRKLQKKGGISIPLALVVGRRIKYMSALRFNSSTAGFKFSDV